MTMRQTTALLLTLAIAGACAKGENANTASADSTARNLTLAPADSSSALRDAPANPPATPPVTAPVSRPTVTRPKPPVASARSGEAGSAG